MQKDDEIITTALLKRFTERRLPRAIKLRDKVFNGEKLSKADINFLDIIFNDATYILRYSDKYPEFQEIVSKGIALYKEITEKALENENKPIKSPKI